jgi:hypothetical protein
MVFALSFFSFAVFAPFAVQDLRLFPGFAIQPIRPYNAPILIHGDNNLHASY